jgi:hypothetical protein
MNYFQYEKMAEDRREEIRSEMKQIRLQEKALSARPSGSNWYTRRMLNLGNWMIAKGKKLRTRYESLPVDRTRPVHRSYAR